MTHPGLAVMMMVGVGLGAVLYYFFASTTEPMGQSNCRCSRPDNNNHSHWGSQNCNKPEYGCMICLEETTERCVYITSCMHVFHQNCIEKWMTTGAGDARDLCPICRVKIQSLSVLR